MVIIKAMGGLGNQMQQYALYQKFISMGKEAYLDKSWYVSHESSSVTGRSFELDVFKKAGYEEASREQINALIGSRNIANRLLDKIIPGRNRHICENSMYMPQILEMDDVYLEGYWSADIYYADIMDRLRDRFGITYFETVRDNEMNDKSREMALKIAECKNACSVHIRRGDYLNEANSSLFGNIATSEYYDSAFSHIRELRPGSVFFIFSDDPEYTREKYGKDDSCVIVDVNHGADSVYDIFLMSLCSAHICANSSFSFWGARLDAGKDAVKIRPTIHMRSQVFDPVLMNDLWKGWTFIDPQGVLQERSAS